MYRSDFVVFYLIKDLYWCFIPLGCRECAFLEQCRYGFFRWRKCRNGCIKIDTAKKREKQNYYERLRKESFDALIEEANKREQRKP